MILNIKNPFKVLRMSPELIAEHKDDDEFLLLATIEDEYLRLVPLSPARLPVGPVQIAEAEDLFKQVVKGFHFFRRTRRFAPRY